jgi:phosphatidylserine/phosphatidylglycerophosphate/cardiolipin synthase-like enzyme
MSLSPMRILTPGATCWRTVRARHLSLIQDAGPTFAAIAAAMEAARETIFILGWDIDSRTLLRPVGDDGSIADGSPLLRLLLACLARQPRLQIFVLIWDFSVIYAFEREPRPREQFEGVHPRLHFSLDADHASGGSHHQKVVVVDDQVAFVGGIDLTTHRWDSPTHALHEPRRRNAAGAAYGPFHDVHAAVAGPAAAALGELARDRWSVRRGRARTPPLAEPHAISAWPDLLAKDVSDVEVGLARTVIARGQPPVKEIEALTLRAIASAQRCLYAENQYLTSVAVVQALGQRLSEVDGPEMVIVLPESESGWMERGSMGLLRERSLAYLRAKDRLGRLRLLAPRVTEGTEGGSVSVHAKVLVIDDTLAKVGSSNFSNRSMGLDTECDLAIEATDGPSAAFVTSVRDRLVAEHLGLAPAEVAARLADGGSLCRLIDGQPVTAGRSLAPVPERSNAELDFTVLDGALVDPEEPWSLDALMAHAVPVPLRWRWPRRWWPCGRCCATDHCARFTSEARCGASSMISPRDRAVRCWPRWRSPSAASSSCPSRCSGRRPSPCSEPGQAYRSSGSGPCSDRACRTPSECAGQRT